MGDILTFRPRPAPPSASAAPRLNVFSAALRADLFLLTGNRLAYSIQYPHGSVDRGAAVALLRRAADALEGQNGGDQ